MDERDAVQEESRRDEPAGGERPGDESAGHASGHAEPARQLPEAALRALAEAEERRRWRDRELAAMPPERGGRKGPEPVRYGDWEVKGIATDF